MSEILTRLTAALDGRYQVMREVGAGGMATVYLARDVRHERDVAIKVLHPDLAAALGAERFLAEIKTTARLQHPHILPLLDSGEADRLLYYVMPFVAGESLRTRLERQTQLSVDEAVRIAREVASALESAHRQGVVHRDIKPENVLLHEDQALVADFGIALAVSAAGGPRMTQTGLSLGTPAYMAPEQAMGERIVDGRADIYALGAMLYEMLVGEAPFTGPTVQAILSRVMTEEPRPISSQRRSVPAHVEAAVMRALEKLPADRFSSAGEFNKALVTADYDAGSGRRPAATNERTHARRFPWADVLPWSIAVVAAIVAAASLVRRAAVAGEQPLTHLSIGVPRSLAITPFAGATIGISADGRKVGFAANSGGPSQILIRDLASDTLRVVQGSSGSAGSIEFSPDGSMVAFNTDQGLWKAPVNGGPPTKLAASRWAQIAWSGNETLIYTRNYDTGLYRISAEGEDSAVVTTPDRKKGELGHWWPQTLPDGEHVLFTNYRTPADKSSLEVVSLRDGKRRVVLESGFHGRYASGYLLFGRGSSVMAVPFDPDNMRTSGRPALLPISVNFMPQNAWAGFAVSANGTLAYLHDPQSPIELTWIDEGGVEQPAEAPLGKYFDAVPSPDGKNIAVIRDGDVWVLERARRVFTRLTRTEQNEGDLLWTPDSRSVLYIRDVPVFDIFKRAADASSPEETVITSASDKSPVSITPDGKTLLFEHDDSADDLMGIDLQTPSASMVRVIGGPGNENNGKFSPDGRWIAYESNESGRPEVYLVPYPLAGGGRKQLSTEGGTNPQWGPDGRTVYFRRAGLINRVRVNPRTGEIGKPEVLTRIPSAEFWSIGPDGRFLIGRQPANSEPLSLKIITNWTALLGETKQR